MFYPKNVPNWERAVRIIFGVVLISLAIIQQQFGVVGAIATGFVGWCPACALVGRKIKQQQSK